MSIREKCVSLTDRIQAMSYAQKSRRRKLGLNRPLDLGIRLDIDTARSLVLNSPSPKD